MLGIILGILKVIGIILLSILGLLFLTILIVLFVPVRYRANGYFKDKKLFVKGRVSYLLSLFRLIVLFDKKLDYYIRVFGIKINLKNRKAKPKKLKVDEKQEETVEQPVQAVPDTKIEYISNNSDEKNIESEIGYEAESENKPEVELETEPEVELETEPESESEKPEDKKSFSEKFEGVKFYFDLLGEDETKEAFRTCKHRIGCALKSILPNKGKIYVAFGSGDAGLVGEIFGFYEALFPYIGNVITFVPYFTEKYVEVSFDIKGRIRASSVIYQLVRIYFDKNCHRLIKILIKKNRRK